jgi:hypothetical protein
MGLALVFFIQKRKIGGHASAVCTQFGMQFSTNFRPPKTAPPRQKIDKNRRKFIKIAKKHEKNVISAKNQ